MKVLKKFMHKYKLPYKSTKYHVSISRIKFMRSLIFKQIYIYNQHFWERGLSPPETKCTILYQNLTINLVSPANISYFHWYVPLPSYLHCDGLDYWYFRVLGSLHLQSKVTNASPAGLLWSWRWEAVSSSKTSITTYQFRQQYIPVDLDLHTGQCQH